MISHLVFAAILLAASGAIAVSAGQRLVDRDLTVAAVDLGFITALIASAIISLREAF